jgi:hypothetical protein
MIALAAPPRATAKPARIIHEAQPAELGADADGVAFRTSRGRVRPSNPVQSVYLFGLLQWQNFAPEVPDGFTRERVWLEPTPDGWCEYTVTDKESR